MLSFKGRKVIYTITHLLLPLWRHKLLDKPVWMITSLLRFSEDYLITYIKYLVSESYLLENARNPFT